MIAQHHQYIDPQQCIDNLHFIFIFRDNNPNYVVFLRYFLGSCRFCFHYTKLRNFRNFMIKNFLNKLTYKIAICFSLFIFRVQSINKIFWWFCFRIFSNIMKTDCRPIIMPYSSPIQPDFIERGSDSLNESIFSFSWYTCNNLVDLNRYIIFITRKCPGCKVLMATLYWLFPDGKIISKF